MADTGADLDEVASLLDLVSRGGTSGVAPASRVNNADIFHNDDGSAIVCKACKKAKNSPDPLDSDKSLLWNTHGRPSEIARHATIDGYCEFVWHK
eukprot:4118842-Heterocapsa_arctica.AAC.1